MTTYVAPCGLCRETKELRDSHLIPRALYKQLRDPNGGTDPNPVLTTEEKAITSSQQVSSYFLCSECEQRFSDCGERYVIAQCARSDGRFNLREQLLATSPLHDRPQFKTYNVQPPLGNNIEFYLYFAASIFWRASVHRWKLGSKPVGKISLGKYEEQFRLYLLNEASFPKNARLQVHVSTGSPSDLLTTVFPYTQRVEQLHRHQFYIPGILFLLFIGGKISRDIDLCALNGSQPQIMWLAPFENTAVFRGAMELVRTTKPAGKLRRKD